MDGGSIRGLCFVNLDISIYGRTVLPSLKPKVYLAIFNLIMKKMCVMT